MRPRSKLAPEWWDYTTLDRDLLDEAAKLTEKDIAELSRPGFKVCLYDTLEEFYLAEALEYIHAWQSATESSPRWHMWPHRSYRATAIGGTTGQ